MVAVGVAVVVAVGVVVVVAVVMISDDIKALRGLVDNAKQTIQPEAFWTPLERVLDALEKRTEALKFYAGDAEKIIEHEGKKFWIKEYGCGCCATNYEVDEDGTPGCGLYDFKVSGLTARQALEEK